MKKRFSASPKIKINIFLAIKKSGTVNVALSISSGLLPASCFRSVPNLGGGVPCN